jgi:thymidylate synthase
MNDLGSFSNLGDAFQAAVRLALTDATRNAGRGTPNRELRMLAFELNAPRARIIDVPARRPNVPFLLAECLWQLARRDDVAMLAHYAPAIGRFSADGRRFTGSAYGDRVFALQEELGESQWDHVLRCLREDPESRRCMIVIADPTEVRTVHNRDVTCTTALHFLVRDRALDLVTTMRSNDLMRGLQSDVFLFTLLQEIAAVQLDISLGTYTHVTNLAQIYESDLEWAHQCARDIVASSGAMNPLPSTELWTAIERTIACEDATRQGHEPIRGGCIPGWMESLMAGQLAAPSMYPVLVSPPTQQAGPGSAPSPRS